MDVTCPQCHAAIATADVNVATDIALCRRCDRTFSFSELIDGRSRAGVDLNAPPSGTWFENLPDGFRAGATTRSWMAIFLVPFTCVWAGGSLTGIYGKQIASGQFDPSQSLFGLPFLIGSVFLISYCLMTVAGEVEVRRQGDRLTVFTGFGPLGWTRTYAWSDFTSVREDNRSNGFNWNRRGALLVMDGKRRVAFGTMLSEERRYFLLSALRQMLRTNSPAGTLAFSRFR
jgi:hypothetical protein